MNFLLEIIRFVIKRKKYWIVPVLFILILLGGLIFLTQGSSVAPFIYTIF